MHNISEICITDLLKRSSVREILGQQMRDLNETSICKASRQDLCERFLHKMSEEVPIQDLLTRFLYNISCRPY